MAITLVRRQKEDTGLRPLKPSRDMPGVADLIEEAFDGEFDRSGRNALREMRWIGRWGVLFSWLDVFGSDVNTNLNGFVWADQGRIIGNATVSRNASGSGNWFVSNVAVTESYRGQGIARQLMDAVVEYVKEMRGRAISLQVHRGNRAAIRLYQSMGFKYISATAFLFMPRVTSVETVPLPKGLTLREHNLDEQDAYAAYQLAKAAVPVNVQQERPLNQNMFRLGAEVSFNNFWRRIVGLGTARYWVVEETPGEFAGTLSVEPGQWNSEHKLSLMVHPDWWGELESCLISIGLTHLKSCPLRPLAFQHPDEHVPAIEAFQRFGFKIKRTHLWMKLKIKN